MNNLVVSMLTKILPSRKHDISIFGLIIARKTVSKYSFMIVLSIDY